MADRKLGSAVVLDRDLVVGMFTVTDACQALAKMFSAKRPQRRPIH